MTSPKQHQNTAPINKIFYRPFFLQLVDVSISKISWVFFLFASKAVNDQQTQQKTNNAQASHC